MKETQLLVFQPLTSPFDFLTVENEILLLFCLSYKSKPLILEQKTLEKGKNTQILHEKRTLNESRSLVCCDMMAAGRSTLAAGVQHLLHLKSKSKILQPIEIMGFFYEIFCQI